MIRRLSLAMALICVCSQANASRYNFDYTMTGAEYAGLERSFDDGSNTVLKFAADLQAIRPTIVDANGTVLRYRAIGTYAVLPGLQRQLLVYANGSVAQVRYALPPPASFTPAPFPAASATQSAPVLPSRSPTNVAGAVSTQSSAAPAVGSFMTQSAPSVAAVTAPAPAPTAPAAAAAPAVPKEEPSPVAKLTASDRSEALILTPTKPVWSAAKNDTLRHTVEAWANKAGWTVVWDAGVDYALVGTVRYEGDFLDAMREIFKAHANVDSPLRAAAYTRQKLVHISE